MSFVRNHPVISFFVLAYALAWAAVPFGSFFAPGALVAALIVVFLTEGLAGLRALGARLIRWRVRWVWYVAAIAVPLARALRDDLDQPGDGRTAHRTPGSSRRGTAWPSSSA